MWVVTKDGDAINLSIYDGLVCMKYDGDSYYCVEARKKLSTGALSDTIGEFETQDDAQKYITELVESLNIVDLTVPRAIELLAALGVQISRIEDEVVDKDDEQDAEFAEKVREFEKAFDNAEKELDEQKATKSKPIDGGLVDGVRF